LISLQAGARVRREALQDDYLGWIARAKREAEKPKCLDCMLKKLRGGKLYVNMAWGPRAERG